MRLQGLRDSHKGLQENPGEMAPVPLQELEDVCTHAETAVQKWH